MSLQIRLIKINAPVPKRSSDSTIEKIVFQDSLAPRLMLTGCESKLKKCQFERYTVITLKKETVSSVALATDSVLLAQFLNFY